MIGINVLFWMYVFMFGIIGSMHGWAKELLVTFSVILAIFIITVLERFIPFVRDTLSVGNGAGLFWLRVSIVAALVFFGYQTPNLPKFSGSNRFVRERLQDTLLGLFLGAVNGFLIFGTIWFFLNEAKYPFSIITAPIPGSSVAAATKLILPFLPPFWLGSPAIYFAVAIAFVFVLVVFI